jgi:hypothetical protein
MEGPRDGRLACLTAYLVVFAREWYNRERERREERGRKGGMNYFSTCGGVCVYLTADIF